MKRRTKESYVVLDQDGNRITSENGRQYYGKKTAREIAKFFQHVTGKNISKQKVDEKGKK